MPKSMIEIINKTGSEIDLKMIRSLAKAFMRVHGKEDLELSIAFIGDRTIRRLNKIYRRIDKVTDVLAFEGEEGSLGEILIDYRQVKRQAKEFGSSEKGELALVLVHGLFHLLGMEDRTERGRKKMAKLQDEFLRIHYDKYQEIG